ncbi:hypothetical protein RF11_13473 [Thelohanellus kitauei]|uniref:Uncharacterized protein n=1 Tax=Thelohanellus kitauei TaxID=669202 RepID=A0A0C2MU46_THEKT|nr:hypothetical protein RF11_13473 [Thelohanellus kitauei]
MSNEYYELADDLRRKINEKHVCLYTSDFIIGFCKILQSICNENIKCNNSLRSPKSTEALFGTICRKCVPLWEIHYKYYLEIHFFSGKYESSSNISKCIDFLMKNNHAFIDELCERIGFSKLYNAEEKERIKYNIRRS